MNFDFSDDQKQLRDQARKFLTEKCSPKAVRAILDGKAPYDKALWKGLAEMGFLGVAIPEDFGGAGAGHLELCVIAEEMGRANAPVPFSSTVYLAAEALLIAGSDSQKKKWLPAIASGEAIGTLALFEGKGNPSPKNVKFFDGCERRAQRCQEAGCGWRDCRLRSGRGTYGIERTRW
ncbi:alkylation response protein AidB-like acyl-CoA dehydrogenase [Bradyrhizobium sp. LM6.10]